MDMFVLSIEFLMRAVATSLAGFAFTITPAHTDASIRVLMNEARIVRLAHDADTVIVGNPAIADATVQDARTIVLTGKGFGITNLIILDRQGKQIVDDKVFVARNTERTMRVYREADVQTFFCSPSCEGAYMSPGQRQSDREISSSSK